MIPLYQSRVHPVTQHEYPSILCGVIAPLFTPERLDGKIHFDGLEAMADYLCAKPSVSAILIRAHESRMWNYTLAEVRDAIRCVSQVARGRKPVIAGTAGIWSGCAEEHPRPAEYFRRAADLSQWALASGASAVMQPVPAFLEGGWDYTPQDRIVRFYTDLGAAVNGPILIYNQQGLPLTYSLTPESLSLLSQRRQFVGVIYHTSDASLLADIVRSCDPRFCVIAGCDSVAVSAFMSGATSTAGGVATLLPEVIDAAWQSLHEPNLPFTWRTQTDLLKLKDLLTPYDIADVGCAVLARQGIAVSSRSRAPRRPPMSTDVERMTREINYLRAAYL